MTDQQPGGSGACPDCAAESPDCLCKMSPEQLNAFTDELRAARTGGSGAGSTVETSEAMPTGVIHDLGCRCWPHIEASAVTQLRADLKAARGENAELRRQLGGRVTVAEEIDRRHEAVSRISADLAQARARRALQDAVVEAARAVAQAREAYQTDAHVVETNAVQRAKERYRAAFTTMIVALHALDAAQAAGASESLQNGSPDVSTPKPAHTDVATGTHAERAQEADLHG